MRKAGPTLFYAFFSSCAAPGAAHAADWVEGIDLRPIADIRFRTEAVGREDFDARALAHTLRARFGVQATPIHGVTLLVEGEGVANLNDRFNSTTNGNTGFPVVADPEALELNRAQVEINAIPKTKVTIGRQRINLDNQRFVGAVDFRQNQQTFDAVRVEVKPREKLSVEYAYIDHVHRIFGDNNPNGEFRSDSHIGRVTLDKGKLGKVTAYILSLDFQNAPAVSSLTWGFRHINAIPIGRKNKKAKLSYTVEYARQADNGRNPINYSANYVLTEGALSNGHLTFKAGYERLGSDGVAGFSTPLATLHKFQGFADAFLTTPTDGIQDFYLGFGAAKSDIFGIKKVTFKATGHSFATARNSRALGRELDLQLAFKINKNVSAELKGALFAERNAGPPDRNVLWASVRFSL